MRPVNTYLFYKSTESTDSENIQNFEYFVSFGISYMYIKKYNFIYLSFLSFNSCPIFILYVLLPTLTVSFSFTH